MKKEKKNKKRDREKEIKESFVVDYRCGKTSFLCFFFFPIYKAKKPHSKLNLLYR